MNTRGLPGMLAPMYHEEQDERSVAPAASPTWPTHASSASRLAPIRVGPREGTCSMQSAIHSTCCSIDGSMLVSTDGLPGPVMVKKLGKPARGRPREVLGPSL